MFCLTESVKIKVLHKAQDKYKSGTDLLRQSSSTKGKVKGGR